MMFFGPLEPCYTHEPRCLSPGIWLISNNIAATSGVVPLSMIC
jgi:hypothetical protein